MTPRETLFCALNGDETETVPVWLLFPYHPTGYSWLEAIRKGQNSARPR